MKMKESQFELIKAQLKKLTSQDCFYGKKLAGINVDAIKSQEDFEKLPFTWKGDLREAYPLGLQAVPDEEIVRIVDEVIDYIKSTGVTYYVGPCETAMEGDYEQLMEIVKQCQYIAVKAGAPSVMSYVKITYKPDGEKLTIERKTAKHHVNDAAKLSEIA